MVRATIKRSFFLYRHQDLNGRLVRDFQLRSFSRKPHVSPDAQPNSDDSSGTPHLQVLHHRDWFPVKLLPSSSPGPNPLSRNNTFPTLVGDGKRRPKMCSQSESAAPLGNGCSSLGRWWYHLGQTLHEDAIMLEHWGDGSLWLSEDVGFWDHTSFCFVLFCMRLCESLVPGTLVARPSA